MVTTSFVVSLIAREGREGELAGLLTDALGLAEAEEGTTVWLALRTGDRTFAIVDAFPDAAARQVHLDGPIAAALMEHGPRLLAEEPRIEPADVLAAKLP